MALQTYYLVDRACAPVTMQTIAYPELTRLEPYTICGRGAGGKCCECRDGAEMAARPSEGSGCM